MDEETTGKAPSIEPSTSDAADEALDKSIEEGLALRAEKEKKLEKKLLTPRIADNPAMQRQFIQDWKNWFDLKFGWDKRAECIADVEKIINVPADDFMSYDISTLNRMQYRLAQLRLPIASLTAELIRDYQFSYIYRKMQTAKRWTSKKDSVIRDGVRITNGEVDQIVEVEIWKERSIEVFMQERADFYKNLLDCIDSTLVSIRYRIKELDAERYTKQTDNYGQK